MNENAKKQFLVGIAGGLVTWWAIDRLYSHSRSGEAASTAPYWAGAAIGVAYGAFVLRRNPAVLARAPLVAALQTGAVESRGNPSGQRQSLIARIAAMGIQRVTRAMLF
jgi:hypothetical protein